MKKIICICLAVLIFAGISGAFASGIIDFSIYSDEELNTIIEELNEELATRGIGKTATISPGRYLVGRDIPAGKYVLANETGDTAYFLILQDNLKDYSDSDALDRGNLWAGSEYSFAVEVGQVLETRHQRLKLTISSGVIFK